jgi:hypothetical protein
MKCEAYLCAGLGALLMHVAYTCGSESALQHSINWLSEVTGNADLIVWAGIPFFGVVSHQLLHRKVTGITVLFAALLSVGAAYIGHLSRSAFYIIPWLCFGLDLNDNRLANFLSSEVLFAGVKVLLVIYLLQKMERLTGRVALATRPGTMG